MHIFYPSPLDFQIIAAIDLLHGTPVSLYKGSLEQVETFPRASWNIAEDLASAGVDGLVLIDLDGVAAEQPVNVKTLARIRQHFNGAIAMGGGVRTMDDAAQLFAAGADRVIVGTPAVTDESFLQELLEKYGADKIIVGISARESGEKVTLGNKGKTQIDTLDFALDLEMKGVQRVLFTDIARSGTLSFPNFDMAERLASATKLKVWLRGGFAKEQQIQLAHDAAGVEAVVIGKAFLTHELDPADVCQE